MAGARAGRRGLDPATPRAGPPGAAPSRGRPAGGRRGGRGGAGRRSSSKRRSPAPRRSPTPSNSKSSARSNSPARRRGAISSGSSSARVTSTPGWAARKAAIARGIRVAPAVGKEAVRRCPPRPAAIAAISSSAASIWARMPPTWPASAAPAAVGRTPPRLRSISGTPASPSSVCDRLGDRRLRVVERVGGGREGAVRDDLAKDVQTAPFEHKQSLSLKIGIPVALMLSRCHPRSRTSNPNTQGDPNGTEDHRFLRRHRQRPRRARARPPARLLRRRALARLRPSLLRRIARPAGGRRAAGPRRRVGRRARHAQVRRHQPSDQRRPRPSWSSRSTPTCSSSAPNTGPPTAS